MANWCRCADKALTAPIELATGNCRRCLGQDLPTEAHRAFLRELLRITDPIEPEDVARFLETLLSPEEPLDTPTRSAAIGPPAAEAPAPVPVSVETAADTAPEANGPSTPEGKSGAERALKQRIAAAARFVRSAFPPGWKGRREG